MKAAKNKIETNIYIATIYRFIVMMLIFQISRLGFYLFNIDSFSDTSFSSYLKVMRGGFVFDLAALLYTNAIYIVLEFFPFKIRENKRYQKVAKYIFIITNSAALIVNTVDYIYFKYTFRRTTSMVFNEFKNETNIGSMFWQFFADYWYLLFVIVPLIYLMIWLYDRVVIGHTKIKSKLLYYPISLFMLALAIFLFIGGVRGGYAHSTRPITISNATEYITNAGEEFIVLNTPFSIYRTIGQEKLNEYHFYDTDTLKTIYSPIHTPKDTTSMNKKNVVVIILESFGREYVGALNKDENIKDYKGYTPFLDSLIGESLYFKHAFANGKKSIDAMASIMASIPSFTKPFILSAYSHNKFASLNSLLGGEGYTTAFYHGAPNGSMGFLAFSKKIGTELYIGKDEYNNDNDFDGMWAIWDEPFMQFMAHNLSTLQEPFAATLFTASSHHPYKVPAKYEGSFDKGNIPMHQAIGYSDMALRKFFETAKKQGWYENTIFVITADHTNLEYYDMYKTTYGRFYIPIVFYTPNGDLKGEREQTIQQIDILPTILEYLSYDKPFFSFGTSLLTESEEDAFAVTYYNSEYEIYYGDYLLTFNGEKSTALYDYKHDWQLKDNLLDKEIEIRDKIERKGKAFLQTYNHAMINDKMVVQ
ncbi:MAG: sulfatase-like hydrolase/transferase [Rikenellaceae bacterium]